MRLLHIIQNSVQNKRPVLWYLLTHSVHILGMGTFCLSRIFVMMNKAQA